MADYEQNAHGIQIRQVANGYKFSTKAEHHEILRKYVKSLKPPVRLSKPALETLAVIAYRQPVTMPEIEEIRGVDSGGVIHTLLEKKLVVTSGRKSVVGRPILYRTSKDFLVHFGLKDVGELPSLKEFEELAKRALGSEWAAEEASAASARRRSSAEAGTDGGEAAPETPPEAPLPAPRRAAPVDKQPVATEAHLRQRRKPSGECGSTTRCGQEDRHLTLPRRLHRLRRPGSGDAEGDSSDSESAGRRARTFPRPPLRSRPPQAMRRRPRRTLNRSLRGVARRPRSEV